MMHLRRKYALLLLTVFVIGLPASAWPLDCCCTAQTAVETAISKSASEAGCHNEVNQQAEADREAQHCSMSEANALASATEPDNSSSQKPACCSGPDEASSTRTETVADVSHHCSMECMVINSNETDQAVSLSRINTASPVILLQISQTIRWMPRTLSIVLSLDSQSTGIDSPPIFLIYSSFLI